MTNNKSNDSRRKLLKSITAGSGAIVAGKSLPESWRRPIVDSVMLPAHAQTSPPETVSKASCGPATATAVEFADDDDDQVNIIFNGGVSCNLTVTQESVPLVADAVIGLDLSATGGSAGTWVVNGSGSNWNLNNPYGTGDLDAGPFEFTATRVGDGVQCRLNLDVAIEEVSDSPPTYEMTVSNVEFTTI